MNDDSKRALWIQTYAGLKFHPWAPSLKSFLPRDVAHSLSNLCRFNGHCREFYCVAQHSCVVAGIAMNESGRLDVGLHALLHDAAEAYVGDLVRPIKKGMPEFGLVEDGVHGAMYQAWGLRPMDKVEAGIVRWADNVALATERRDLMGEAPAAWEDLPSPCLDHIAGVNPFAAERMFLDMFYALHRAYTRDTVRDDELLAQLVAYLPHHKIDGAPGPFRFPGQDHGG